MDDDVARFYGPIDPELLIFQNQHRCNNVLKNVDNALDNPLTVRGLESVVWGTPTRRVGLHRRILAKLDVMSFYGVYSCLSQKVDPHLITALVERWRKETHTFHLPVGEATVTLEDVGILWALPVQGTSVSGVIESKTTGQWRDYCERLIGYRPGDDALKGTKLSMRKLANWLEANPIVDESTDEEVEQHARAYALLLIGSVMFPDSSGSTTSVYFLQPLEDIDRVRDYSWASAVLAFMYRELCTSCEEGKLNIGGAMRLLQVWAWMRILPLQPVRVASRVIMSESDYGGIHLHIPPPAARWNALMDHTCSTNSNLRTIRESLDSMSMSQFVWTPYDDLEPEIATLRDECRPPCCRSTCLLIFFNIVEMHYPERVVRQFGMIQSIPPMPIYRDVNLHQHERRNIIGRDWRAFHSQWETRWESRDDTIMDELEGGNEISCTAGYYDWYYSITRR